MSREIEIELRAIRRLLTELCVIVLDGQKRQIEPTAKRTRMDELHEMAQRLLRDNQQADALLQALRDGK